MDWYSFRGGGARGLRPREESAYGLLSDRLDGRRGGVAGDIGVKLSSFRTGVYVLSYSGVHLRGGVSDSIHSSNESSLSEMVSTLDIDLARFFFRFLDFLFFLCFLSFLLFFRLRPTVSSSSSSSSSSSTISYSSSSSTYSSSISSPSGSGSSVGEAGVSR